MRTETFRGGERRAARMHWLREVLKSQISSRQEEIFDEVLVNRFWAGPENEMLGLLPNLS